MSTSTVYQVEILEPLLELIRRSDVTAHLSLAVEQVREHFAIERRRVRIDVRHNRRGELEGIGFFDPDHGDLLAHITAFYLDREGAEGAPREVLEALRTTSGLAARLRPLFS